MAEVAPGVYRLGTHVVNWYVVEDGDALIAVDAGLSGFADTVEADLGAHGLEPPKVEAVTLLSSSEPSRARLRTSSGCPELTHGAHDM